MFPCPTCDTSFETRRGLGVHHSSVHDERLPNRECNNCGTEFHCNYQKTYCSDTCRQDSVSYEGEANPNYQGKKRVTQCEICTNKFEFYASQKTGQFCPRCVKTERWRSLPDIDAERNPMWKGGKLELECAICDEPIERYPSNITGKAAVCSEDCRRFWLSESFSGDGHPNWKGGGNEPYGKGWSSVRRQALERDGHSCVICSKSSEDIGRNPDVHHITPVRAYIESDHHEKEDAHSLDNVVSLCIECHRRADFEKIPKARLRFLIGVAVTGRTEDQSGDTICD